MGQVCLKSCGDKRPIDEFSNCYAENDDDKLEWVEVFDHPNMLNVSCTTNEMFVLIKTGTKVEEIKDKI